MGTLYWQINDCWPVASWATIDYYGKWKAQQYTMKELFKPIVVSINNEGDDFTVHAISDKMKPTKGKLVSKIFKIDGTLIWENEQYVKLKSNESKLVVNTSIKKILHGISEKEVYLRSYFVEKDKIVANNHYLFVSEKDFRLLKPQIKLKAEKAEKGYKLTFKTNTFSRKVFLSIVGIEGFFHTNYFDLSPDRDEIIFFETSQNIKDIEVKINTYSLVDSFL
jgi:beta-mannosidase